MAINEEYLSYYHYLQSINFDNILAKLKKKYDSKKIVLFGTGDLLDVLLDEYHITEHLNIVGISDTHIENQNIEEYKGLNVYKPLALRSINFNILLDINPTFHKTKHFLRTNHYVRKNIIIDKLLQIPILDKIKSIYKKQKALLYYAKTSKNLIQSAYYAMSCTAEELISKANYINKLEEIKHKKDAIRVAFLCSNTQNTDFLSLYNLLKQNPKFNVYPLILIPDVLIETQEINEEKMLAKVNNFNKFNIPLIDGWDRETKDLTCLHAFKPDLIFYQNPIFIKSNFSPHKMSQHALTFNVLYDITTSDFKKMCSDYYKKQVSNLWKVFVKNAEDKTFYKTYTNLFGKNIVINTNNKINLKILEYFTEEFELNK